MRYHHLFLAVAIMIVACATPPEDRRTVPVATKTTSQQDLADQARDQREQAYQLRDMSERRAVEAEVQANELGPEHESVQRKRKLAQELEAAADEAEQHARDLRQQVPHGMVQ